MKKRKGLSMRYQITSDSTCDLSPEQLERYKKQFQNPEHFFRVGGEIKAIPYKPEKDHER